MEYTDISISTYLEVQQTIANKGLTDDQRMVEICKALFNIDIENLPVAEAVELMDKATKLLSSNFKSSDSPIVSKLNINGTKCTVTDMDSMTFSQFIDYQNFSKDANTHLIDILAVAIVPCNAHYNDGSYNLSEFKESLSKLPITTALSIVNFLVNKSLSSLIYSAICLPIPTEASMKERMKIWWNKVKMVASLMLMKFHLAH